MVRTPSSLEAEADVAGGASTSSSDGGDSVRQFSKRKRWYIGQAIAEEAREISRWWGGDWFGLAATRANPAVVGNAALYTFSYSFLTSASFGFLYTLELRDTWSVAVSFASGGITGVFMALLGGQPAVLYGQTGPVVLLYCYIYTVAEITKVPFGPWVAWIGFWAFLMHSAIALFAVNDYKNRVTRFTAEIFEVLVASDYITSAIVGIIGAFAHEAYDCTDNLALCSLNGFTTMFLAVAFYCTVLKLCGLHSTVRWSSARLLRGTSRFGALISLMVFTVLSYIPQWIGAPGWPSSGIPNRVEVPTWGQTDHDFLAFQRMGDVPAWAIWAALVPAFLLTVLFYVDQNLSTMAAVSGLRSPEAFNFDFFLLGITVLITGLLGLPASSGLIPQNPMHTRALHLSKADQEGGAKYAEQRFSGLLHSLLLLACTFLQPIVGLIPTGLLWGAFFLLASEAYHAELVQRSLLMLTSRNLKQKHGLWDDMSHFLGNVPFRTVQCFTAVQGFCFLVLYVLAVLLKYIFPIQEGYKWVTVGALFPVLVCICAIPVRSAVLPCVFREAHLEALDPSASSAGAHTADVETAESAKLDQLDHRGLRTEDDRSKSDADDATDTTSTGDVDRPPTRSGSARSFAV